MKFKLIELQKSIKENLALFEKKYNNAISILNQINLLLEYGFSNDKIERWFHTNRHAILIIEEILYKENR